MSNLSDIKHIGDAFDTRAAAYTDDAPAPADTNPLLGLALVLSSAIVTCGTAYLVLAG